MDDNETVDGSDDLSPEEAQDFYDAAKALRFDVAVPSPHDKVLLLADIGLGPQKYSAGQYQDELHFKASDGFTEAGAVFLTQDHFLCSPPALI